MVDREAISSSVLTALANDLSMPITQKKALENFTGNSLNYSLKYIETIFGQPLPSDFEQQFRTKSFEQFSLHLRPIDRIHDVLKNLTIPFCVASSGPTEKIIRNLATTNLMDFFEGKIFSSYEIQN